MTQGEYVNAHFKGVRIIQSCVTREHIWAADKYVLLLDRIKPIHTEHLIECLTEQLDKKAEIILF